MTERCNIAGLENGEKESRANEYRQPLDAGKVKTILQLNLFIYLFIYLFLVVLSLHCCVWAFSSCSEPGLLFIEVHRLLIVVPPLVVGPRP